MASKAQMQSAALMAVIRRRDSAGPATQAVHMSGTARQVLLHDTPFSLRGVSSDDGYFTGVRDNLEEQLSSILDRMLPVAPGIWDIGANIGVTALTMAAGRPNAQIVAVEGGPTLYRILADNIRENGRTNQIKAVHSAVGESDGRVGFCEDSAYGHTAIGPNAVQVPLISAATLFREEGPKTLDFIKIDIEGGEFPFLRGGLDLFKNQSPILYMEFNVWCLLHYARTFPMDFMEWIVSNFADVRILPHNGLEGSERVTVKNQVTVLAKIMVEMNSICNLLICAKEERIHLP
jgi:FkbM family methyltransferase